ncbi:hypothetical protein [Acidiferrobacter sp.]|uniref:hypothetical protein n=1 Tax=Acidiferrobacter sp. TaxID=1872107 RepID=UPI0026072341|nr:hypothetical protein [Acidiferrobacter sp.]
MGHTDPVFARKRRLRRAIRITRKYKGTVFGAATIFAVFLAFDTIASFLVYHKARELIPVAISHISVPLIAVVFVILATFVVLPVVVSGFAGIASKNMAGGDNPGSEKRSETDVGADPKEAKEFDVPEWKKIALTALGTVVWLSVAFVMSCPYFLSGKFGWKTLVWLVGLPAAAWFLIPFIAVCYARLRGSASIRVDWKWICFAALVDMVLLIYPVIIFAEIIAHRYLQTNVHYGLYQHIIMMCFFFTIYGFPNAVFWLFSGPDNGTHLWFGSSGWWRMVLGIASVSLIGIAGFFLFLPTGAWQGLVLRTAGYGGYRVCYVKPGGKPSQVYVLLNLGKQVYIGPLPKSDKCSHTKSLPLSVLRVELVPFNDLEWPKRIIGFDSHSIVSRCGCPVSSVRG